MKKRGQISTRASATAIYINSKSFNLLSYSVAMKECINFAVRISAKVQFGDWRNQIIHNKMINNSTRMAIKEGDRKYQCSLAALLS